MGVEGKKPSRRRREGDELGGRERRADQCQTTSCAPVSDCMGRA